MFCCKRQEAVGWWCQADPDLTHDARAPAGVFERDLRQVPYFSPTGFGASGGFLLLVALLGDLANGLETKKVIVAHHLPLRDRFMQELESFEVKTTAAGNTVLDARATEHHADLAVAAALALYLSNNKSQGIEVRTLAGLY